MIPLVGDWNGTGFDGVGLYDPSNGMFWLRNELTPGGADIGFMLGAGGTGDVPVVGDWDGEGDGVGLQDAIGGGERGVGGEAGWDGCVAEEVLRKLGLPIECPRCPRRAAGHG